MEISKVTQITQVRQGDVFVRRVDALPENLVPVPKDKGRVIVSYGEVTGHAHAIVGSDVELFKPGEASAAAELYLKVRSTDTQIRHEEHGWIDLPVGDYIVRPYQREYTPQEIVRVAD